MKDNPQSNHQILVNEPGLLLTQCLCCGEVELHFRGLAMTLILTDLYALLARLESLPVASHYRVGLLDIRDIPIAVSFQAISLKLTESERNQLVSGLNLACLRLDLSLMMRNQLPLN